MFFSYFNSAQLEKFFFNIQKILISIQTQKSLFKYFEIFQINIQLTMSSPYSRYPVNLNNFNTNPTKSIILGKTGCGKTSILNKLCNTDYNAGESTGSMTRGITENQVICKYPFFLIDTPGTDSTEETYKHAVLLKESLIRRPLNVIFIQERFNHRWQKCISQLFKLSKMLKKYIKNIVFLVSAIDQSQNVQSAINMMNACFTKHKMQQQVIYYSNIKTDKQKLANFLYAVATSYPQIKIEITETQFMEKFNVAMLDQFFQPTLEEYLKQIEGIAKLYSQHLKQLEIDDETQDIIAFLSIDLKYELEKILDQFIDKYREDMDQFEYYNAYISLQLKTKDYMENFQNLTRTYRTSTYYIEQENSTKDVRDLIKKCPNCSLIWFKVIGCENTTTCGNKPNFWDYFKNKTKFKYFIQRVGFKLKISKQVMKPIQQNQIKINQKTTTGGVGCGANLVWNTLPRLPNIDQILLQLYQVKSIEQVMSHIDADKKLKQTKTKIESEAKSLVNEGMSKI